MLRRALAAAAAERVAAGAAEEKRLLINRSGVIEFIADGADIGDVGGLEGLKRWLLERRKLFELRDDLNSEIVPKGLLMMGIPGCGKSLAVKAIASHFGLPLYRVDMIEIFSGGTESRRAAFVEACRLVEELVPAVLWFDEIEMGSRRRMPAASRDGCSRSFLRGCRRRRADSSWRRRRIGSIKTMSRECATLLSIASRCRCNILVSGGTGSGKTTLLNCLTGPIDHGERIITIEDLAELQLQQPHVVRLETRPPSIEGSGEISMRALVKASLRMRPERIIIGEVRGAEAIDLLQAMNTGHPGSMGTVHANSAREALSRIESMVAMGAANLPSRMVREQIATAINLIVQVARLRDGSRKVVQVSEVVGMEGDVVTLQDLFVFQQEDDGTGDKVIGSHKSTGIRPHFWDEARAWGLEAQLGIGPWFRGAAVMTQHSLLILCGALALIAVTGGLLVALGVAASPDCQAAGGAGTRCDDQAGSHHDLADRATQVRNYRTGRQAGWPRCSPGRTFSHQNSACRGHRLNRLRYSLPAVAVLPGGADLDRGPGGTGCFPYHSAHGLRVGAGQSAIEAAGADAGCAGTAGPCGAQRHAGLRGGARLRQ